MKLTDQESALLFSLMADLSGELNHVEIRERVGHSLLKLLDADNFGSYIWDEGTNQFISGVHINVSEKNLSDYNQYYRFKDPITPTLQRRRKATPVRKVMLQEKLCKTEFYNDFLKRDGMHYGINFFAYDRGSNIGDIRIWRSSKKQDFSSRDVEILNAIGPSFVNALLRAQSRDKSNMARRFSSIGSQVNLTARESEIADLLAIGASDDEICNKLLISKSTLRTHITAIFRKTGVNRRSQMAGFLAAYANNVTAQK